MRILANDNRTFLIIVARGDDNQSAVDGVARFSIEVSDPSDTCTYDRNARTLTPNGNIGIVTVTAKDSVTGVQTVETINVTASENSNPLLYITTIS